MHTLSCGLYFRSEITNTGVDSGDVVLALLFLFPAPLISFAPRGLVANTPPCAPFLQCCAPLFCPAIYGVFRGEPFP